jgi:hypothetical protein
MGNQLPEVTVLANVDLGTITSADETFCNAGGDPSNISFSIPPSGGAGTFTYQWYSQVGSVACPSGTSTAGWTLIGGATGSSYDPPGTLTQTTTYAVQVNASGTPDCGVATWANNCRKVTVLAPINSGTLTSADQIFCAGSQDPSLITFSIGQSGGSGSFDFQWYYLDGIQTCPSGTNTAGWTLIVGATSSNYDPPAGLTSSRTYAVLVDPTGTPDCGAPTWATNCRKITVLPVVDFGTISSGDEALCIGGDPSAISLSTPPSGGAGTFSYQWYYQDGLVACPTGTNTAGWTLIGGATANNYNPPAGLNVSRTYAVLVDDSGSPDCGIANWANGCRKITVFSAVNFGTVTSGDETFCAGSNDPTNITFSISPSGGSGNFNYQWYFQNGLATCPTGTSTAGWTLIGGATGNSFDPPATVSASITYAVQVDPIGSPDCGVATWANGCRKITVLNAVNFGTLTSADQTFLFRPQ